MKTLTILFFCLITTGICTAQSLDGDFGIGGKVIMAGQGTIGSIIPLPNLKIVATCRFDTGIALMKFKENGTIDSSFATNGMYVAPHEIGLGKIILQPDGKILSEGASWPPSSHESFHTMRFNVDGSVDNTFGTAGKVITRFDEFGNHEGHAIALQPDGKIVIAGSARGTTIGVARLLPDGTPDSSFSADGLYTFNTGLSNGDAKAVAVRSDGRIIVGGQTHNGTDQAFIALCLLPDGSLDTAFNHTGYAATIAGDIFNYVRAMKLQADGKIVMAGSGIFGAEGGNFTLIRYKTDGTLDNTFGTGGIVNIDFYGNEDEAECLTILPDNKILVGGIATLTTNHKFAMVRLLPDGSLDHTFGSEGKIWTAMQDSSDFVNSIAVQPDNKIILAGASTGIYYQRAMARYLPFATELNEISGRLSEIILLPNPAKGMLYLHGEAMQVRRITATNAAGITRNIEIEKNSGTINIQKMEEGLYIFRIFYVNNTIATQKIMIHTGK